MENLLLPTKIEFLPGETPHSGSLVVAPCYFGYGTTLGNTLRRVLLSSLPGAAVEAFKIKGAQHEFSALEGVKEDAVQIILNLKQLAVKVHIAEPVTLSLSKKGRGAVIAADFGKNANVEIINKDLIIANLTGNRIFEMDIIVGNGRGYKAVEEKDRKSYDLGTMVIDSLYSPIKDVGYTVEYTRVGDVTNYEKLTLNIETNGAVSPRDAVREATQVIMNHFSLVLSGMDEGEDAAKEEEIAAVAGDKVKEGEAAKEEKSGKKTAKKTVKVKKTVKKKEE